MPLTAYPICVAMGAAAYVGDPPKLLSGPPELARSVVSVEQFTPAGWRMERKVIGDLNRDGRADVVAVLRGMDPTCLVKTDGPAGSMNTNPRVLLVALRTTAGLVLAVANPRIIPRIDDPYMDDPFDAEGLEIRAGALRLRLSYWRSMGGWNTSSTTMSFRWDGDAFRMIGFDRESLQRNSGETKTVSVNFLTGRAKIVTGSMEDDVDDVTGWRRVRRADAPTLEGLGDGLAYEPKMTGAR